MKVKMYLPATAGDKIYALLEEEHNLYYNSNSVYVGKETATAEEAGLRVTKPNVFRWLTSAGNHLEVVENDDSTVVEYSGRRHALLESGLSCILLVLQEECKDFEYIDTQRPDLKPWETAS